jgi:hypothetical protein
MMERRSGIMRGRLRDRAGDTHIPRVIAIAVVGPVLRLTTLLVVLFRTPYS